MSTIINVGILAHVDAGKTSLTERILFHAGVIPHIGAVDQGTTQTDTLDLERQRGITIRSAVVSFTVGDRIVNLIDTPGHPDFIAEVERALGVLDAVILVVSAVEGVQPQTRRLARAISGLGLPCIVFANKIDRVGARNDSLLTEIRDELDWSVISLSLVEGIATREATSKKNHWHDAESQTAAVEVLTAHDDSLLASYVDGGGELTYQQIDDAMQAQMARCVVAPVVFGSAMTGAGIEQVFDALERLPVADRATTSDVSAEVFKVVRDSRGERSVICRVWSGQLALRSQVEVYRFGYGNEVERVTGKITGLFRYRDGRSDAAPLATAGDMVRLTGLPDARIGDWLGSIQHERVRAFEPPVFEYSISAVDPARQFVLNQSLADLADEDPLIGLRRDDRGEETFIHIYGDVQREVLDATLRETYGIEAKFGQPRVLCVERLCGEGRAAEIWGETDPPFYATVGFRIRPMLGPTPTWHFTPGKARKGFFDAAEEGGRSVLAQGIYGWPVIDLDVEVTDLIYLVTSVPVDYRHLAMLTMADALRDAGTVVCEPVHAVTIRAPQDAIGAVIHALTSRRGVLVETTMMETRGIIRGTIPAAEIDELARSLPGLTNGTADLDSRFHDYVPIEGEPPRRARTDMNPFSRPEFMSRLSGRF